MSFELVSKTEWSTAITKFYNDHPEDMRPQALNSLINNALVDTLIPKRATKQSAGYDFKIPFSLNVRPGIEYLVPTGIKCNFDTTKLQIKKEYINISPDKETWYWYSYPVRMNLECDAFLALYPRSSFGFKYGFQLLNTTGIIDKDYYNNSDNEGHIIVGFISSKEFTLSAGDRFCQSIFQPFMIDTEEDAIVEERVGGMGSTD